MNQIAPKVDENFLTLRVEHLKDAQALKVIRNIGTGVHSPTQPWQHMSRRHRFGDQIGRLFVPLGYP
jgi:hypothetical protein